MLPWTLFALALILLVVVSWYARHTVVEAQKAIEEAAAIKRTYLRFLEKATRKFGEHKVGRVVNDVLREVQNEVKAKDKGVV